MGTGTMASKGRSGKEERARGARREAKKEARRVRRSYLRRRMAERRGWL
jgi:hypothetical protein